MSFRPYHLLALIPAAGMLGGLPFANREQPFVLGFPFLLFYLVCWIVATAGILWVLLRLDRRAAPDASDGVERAPAAHRDPTG